MGPLREHARPAPPGRRQRAGFARSLARPSPILAALTFSHPLPCPLARGGGHEREREAHLLARLVHGYPGKKCLFRSCERQRERGSSSACFMHLTYHVESSKSAFPRDRNRLWFQGRKKLIHQQGEASRNKMHLGHGGLHYTIAPSALCCQQYTLGRLQVLDGRSLSTHLDLGRNICPSMKTAPERSTYQQEAISPRLKNNQCKSRKEKALRLIPVEDVVRRVPLVSDHVAEGPEGGLAQLGERLHRGEVCVDDLHVLKKKRKVSYDFKSALQ